MSTAVVVKHPANDSKAHTSVLEFWETNAILRYLQATGFDKEADLPKTLRTHGLVTELIGWADTDKEAQKAWGGRKLEEQREIVTIALLILIKEGYLHKAADAEPCQICEHQSELWNRLRPDADIRLGRFD